MAKVYFIRHQARGVIHELPFGQPPTKEQIESLARLCAAAHGPCHPKTEEPYWLKVVEVEVRGPDFVLPPPGPASVSADGAKLSAPTVSATGHVSNPQK